MSTAGSSNPYVPPSATLSDPAGSRPSRFGWKVYFWLLLVLYALALVGMAVAYEVQVVDGLDVVVSVVGFSGLFGYAFSRRLFSRRFWAVWLPLEIAWDVGVNLVLIPMGLAFVSAGEAPPTVLENLFGLLLIAPLYVAIFRYAFRSPELWGSDVAPVG